MTRTAGTLPRGPRGWPHGDDGAQIIGPDRAHDLLSDLRLPEGVKLISRFTNGA